MNWARIMATLVAGAIVLLISGIAWLLFSLASSIGC